MSRALVIKGANFSANKVETVTLSSPVPCEGITLSQNSITATALGVADTLIASLTPADTTDSIIWASSDEDVATVANGVVTITGVGSAIITATCGEQSATCIVSATIVIDASDLTVLHGKCMSTNSDRDYIGASPAANTRTYFASGNQLDGYKAISNADSLYSDKYPIPLPKNATKIVLTESEASFGGGKVGLEDANTLTTFSLSADAKGAKAYLPLISASFSNLKATFNVGSRDANVNSFIVQVYSTASDESTISTGLTIEIS